MLRANAMLAVRRGCARVANASRDGGRCCTQPTPMTVPGIETEVFHFHSVEVTLDLFCWGTSAALRGCNLRGAYYQKALMPRQQTVQAS